MTKNNIIKKVTALLFGTLLFGLIACGDEKSVNNTTPSGVAGTESVSNQENIGKEDAGKNENQQSTESSNEEKVDFKEITVVDNEECLVKIIGASNDSIGYCLKLYLENKSDSKTYMFSGGDAAVNGVQCLASLADTVAPGKKMNSTVYFDSDLFESIGVKKYTEIEMEIQVYDHNDYTADYIVDKIVKVYPYGEDKVVKYSRPDQSGDNVVVDNEYAKVVVTGYRKDEFLGYVADVFILNKTDKNLMFSAKDASINSYMIEPYWADLVWGNKCSFTSISWYDSDLSKNGITNVTDIEFTLLAYDNDNIGAGNLIDTKIKLKP